MYLIAGLGNPGKKYETTRHNAGRRVLNHIHDAHAFSQWEYDKMLKAYKSSGEIEGCEIMLMTPETYMNHSGISIKKALSATGESPEHLIVLHDELDLPIGTFRLSFGRGSAGNKGVASIVKEIGSSAFTRVRIGIAPTTLWGRVKKRIGSGKDFVISPLSSPERRVIAELQEKIVTAVSDIIKHGKEYAMNLHNRKEPQ